MQGKCFNINYKMNLWHKLLSYAFYNYNNCFVDSKTNRTFKQMLKKNKIPLSCNVRKKFLDPFEIEGVLFTIWEITCQGNF